MNVRFTGHVPTLFSGQAITADVVRQLLGGRRATFVVDSNIADAASLARCAPMIELDGSRTDINTVVALANNLAFQRPSVVVAVGGGSVLDATKAAALGVSSANTFRYLIEHAERSGLTVLPPGEPTTDLVAIPTTVGTSSETNSVSIVRSHAGTRLVVGRSLRPRYAIIDSANLMSLPDQAIRTGALEALLRLAGVSTGAGGSARSRRDAVKLGRAIITAANSDRSQEAVRLRIARLSAATQRSAALRSPDPYAARHWYVANETAFILTVTKMAATAAIIGAIWQRIRAGDQRWGARDSLDAFWKAVTDETRLPTDPVAGIESLIDLWAIPRAKQPETTAIREIAAATEAIWGNRRPMLRGIGEQDVHEVLEASRWDTGRADNRPDGVVAQQRG